MAADDIIKKENEIIKKRYRTKIHIISNLKSWCSFIFDEYNKGKNIKNPIEKTKDEIKRIATILFEDIYEGTENFWNIEEYKDWFLKESNKEHCHYCKLSLKEVRRFYKYVDSYRYTRGNNLEIDRKVGRMKDMFKSKEESETFAKKMEDSINSIDSEILKDLRKAFVFEDCLYLPAPYNADNCVLACYWCNNAKTDAFTDKEFKPIGIEIGKKIREILKGKNANERCK